MIPCLSPTTNAKHLHSEFDKINEWLVDHVGTNHPWANLEAANRWLEEEQSKTPASQCSRSKQNFFTALSEFGHMMHIVEGDAKKCSRKSAEILANADASSRDAIERVLKGGDSGKIRRIDDLIYQIAKKHADECQPEYEKQFETIVSKAPEKLIDRAVLFTETIVATHLLAEKSDKLPSITSAKEDEILAQVRAFVGDHPIDATDYVVHQMQPIKGNADSGVMCSLIEKFATEDGDAKLAAMHSTDSDGDMDIKHVVDLFNKYLVNPCEDYMNWVDGVMLPVKMDMKIKRNPFDGKEDHPILDAMVVYETCNKFIEGRAKSERDFLKHIEWRVKILAE